MLLKDKDEVFGWLFQKAMRKVYKAWLARRLVLKAVCVRTTYRHPLLTIVVEGFSMIYEIVRHLPREYKIRCWLRATELGVSVKGNEPVMHFVHG